MLTAILTVSGAYCTDACGMASIFVETGELGYEPQLQKIAEDTMVRLPGFCVVFAGEDDD